MSHANRDTASEHVGYINKTTGARLLKQAFSCTATCIIICWSPSLFMRLGIRSIIIKNSPWRAETFLPHLLIWLRCYIRTMLRTQKSLWPIRKKCCKGSCGMNFIIVLKKNVFIFNTTFSGGWCISSSILRTFRCIKIYIFLRICRSIVLL